MTGLQLDLGVRVGVALSGSSVDAVVAEARGAEERGFDSVWVTDHLAFHVPIPDPFVVLGVAAGVTRRVELGTAVYLLALRPPLVTAKQAATLDRMSGGRFVLGVGLGGEYPPEFESVGVPVRERGARVDETIPLLRRLWSGEKVVHEGRFFRVRGVSVDPGPARSGGPPVWIGGRAPKAMRRAGRLGDGYVSHMTSPERYASNLGAIERAAHEAGRGTVRFGSAAFLFGVLGDSRAAAHERAAGALQRIYARPFEDAAERYCLLGPPDAWVEQLGHYVEAGCRHFILSPLGDSAGVAERVASEVLPQIRGFST